MISAIRPACFDHLQLGAGVFLTDFDPESAADAAALRAAIARAVAEGRTLGVTQGGGMFRCVPALRHVEADGLRMPRTDSVLLTGWSVSLSGRLLELSPEHLAQALPGAALAGGGELLLKGVE